MKKMMLLCLAVLVFSVPASAVVVYSDDFSSPPVLKDQVRSTNWWTWAGTGTEAATTFGTDAVAPEDCLNKFQWQYESWGGGACAYDATDENLDIGIRNNVHHLISLDPNDLANDPGSATTFLLSLDVVSISGNLPVKVFGYAGGGLDYAGAVDPSLGITEGHLRYKLGRTNPASLNSISGQNGAYGTLVLDAAEISSTGTFSAVVTLSDVGTAGDYLLLCIAADNDNTARQMTIDNLVLESITHAVDPTPADGAALTESPVLSWVGPSDANSFDVYIDTVNPPLSLEVNTKDTTYDPDPNLTPGVWYWRVDKVNDDATVTTNPAVWSFEVLDLTVAKNPTPADSAIDVSTIPTLSWDPGEGAISHDVWFGTDPEALELVSDDQAGTSYVPSLLSKNMTYYWAVDEFDGTNTYPGAVWSFSTVVTTATTRWGESGIAAESTEWNIESNWSAGVPGLNSGLAELRNNEPNAVCTIEDGDICYANQVYVYRNNGQDPNSPLLHIKGGSLTASYRFWIGKKWGEKRGIVQMDGGTLSVETLRFGDGGDGILYMNGGTVNVQNTIIFHNANVPKEIHLADGVINAGGLQFMNVNNLIDLSGGTLILDGDDTGTVNPQVTAGVITAYGGTGRVVVDYDNVNPGKTTVLGCPYPDVFDLNANCMSDLYELSVLAQDWLFTTPTQVAWSFDMSTDPVGTGDSDLTATTSNYSMTTDAGRDVMLLSGGAVRFGHQFPYTSVQHDVTLDAVMKSTDPNSMALWLPVGHTGGRAICGLFISADETTGIQTVELWTGRAPWNAEFAPVVLTGFAADTYLTIDVDYNYASAAMDYSVSDGTLTLSDTGVPLARNDNGIETDWQIINETGNFRGVGTAYIDQLDILIDGSNWYAEGDTQPDGKVDLLDLAKIALDWLK